MQGKVSWAGDVTFEAESGTGHSIMMDGPEEVGGQNQGARPMELLLLGTGGCALFDVVSMLKKSRQSFKAARVELQAKRVDAIPAVFESINLHFVISGEGVRESQVARAVQLSAEKYCSASIMLATGGVKVTHSFEIQLS
ncbi:MAG: osmotically inducible protein C [Halieaceae bacterium MED-G27]|jgi:putative redox protein|nr:osmotically inducible protein C [Halieaceae bacterium]OUT65262.1 MAG: osmotically inducible protein C [Cellvibrionales bacterium TMED21]PDH38545.1 MAG: osmotically inducible protein C [Halieaceae bacterium MED-G27]|tara:strand:+ start:7460 stop:7879 length:420 start_codon:yes stop_codon:yes gene_type:complete